VIENEPQIAHNIAADVLLESPVGEFHFLSPFSLVVFGGFGIAHISKIYNLYYDIYPFIINTLFD